MIPVYSYFVRPYDKSRGWVIRSLRSLRSRKLVVSRNVHVVRDPNIRHARLSLSDGLINRHGAFDTAPAACRDAVRTIFALSLAEPQGAALIVDDLPTGIRVVLVPALGADGEHAMASELAWPGPRDHPTSCVLLFRRVAAYCC